MDSNGSPAPRHPLHSAQALLVLAALATPLRADLVVTRSVRADRAHRPGAARAAESCALRAEPPAEGERVRLSVAPGRARRDETALAFVVDLDAGRALVIDHRNRSYAELVFPVPVTALAGRQRAELGAEGERRFPWQLRTQVYESVAHRADAIRVTRAARVANGFGTELEVEAEIQPDAALGRAALAVEVFAQAVRAAGESWLGVLAPPDGIPLSLVEEHPLGATSTRYRELAAAGEPAALDPALFAPPPGYAKVEHDPDCF